MATLFEEVSHFCHRHHLHLNTDLGQHFLIDEMILQAIVEVADIKKKDSIIEIGPGIGILTRELVERSDDVTAIEIDKRLIPLLEDFVTASRPNNSDKLKVIEGNALHAPLPDHPYKMVANIPYHITSPLLRHVFLESPQMPISLTLLIQREVAEKICDTKDAGLLTILVALFGAPSLIAQVPPESFLPPPEVDSAVLHIECFKKPLASKEIMEQIFKLTKGAFAQKRKMLRNTIGKLPQGMEKLAKLNIDPMRRPQTLSIDEWIALADLFL